mmetsp:Transcript_54098/g.136125  ORF Transcript_54098/g.136125 Transcript_54098/m.136125 type:complete len:519 (+) Transcript_54098:1294-2850(+)
MDGVEHVTAVFPHAGEDLLRLVHAVVGCEGVEHAAQCVPRRLQLVMLHHRYPQLPHRSDVAHFAACLDERAVGVAVGSEAGAVEVLEGHVEHGLVADTGQGVHNGAEQTDVLAYVDGLDEGHEPRQLVLLAERLDHDRTRVLVRFESVLEHSFVDLLGPADLVAVHQRIDVLVVRYGVSFGGAVVRLHQGQQQVHLPEVPLQYVRLHECVVCGAVLLRRLGEQPLRRHYRPGLRTAVQRSVVRLRVHTHGGVLHHLTQHPQTHLGITTLAGEFEHAHVVCGGFGADGVEQLLGGAGVAALGCDGEQGAPHAVGQLHAIALHLWQQVQGLLVQCGVRIHLHECGVNWCCEPAPVSATAVGSNRLAKLHVAGCGAFGEQCRRGLFSDSTAARNAPLPQLHCPGVPDLAIRPHQHVIRCVDEWHFESVGEFFDLHHECVFVVLDGDGEEVRQAVAREDHHADLEEREELLLDEPQAVGAGRDVLQEGVGAAARPLVAIFQGLVDEFECRSDGFVLEMNTDS